MAASECCTYVQPDGRVCGLHPIAHNEGRVTVHRLTTQSPAPVLASPCGTGAGPSSASSTGEGEQADSGGVGVLDRARPQPPAFEMVALGQPAPQGSKRHVGHGVMIESSKKVKPWREAVKFAAMEAGVNYATYDTAEPLDGPLDVLMVFTFARPCSHFGTGRNANVLKASAPLYPIGPPDSSKLVRSTEDAIVDAGIIRDDSRLVHHDVWKVYPLGHRDSLPTPGVVVRIWQVTS